ncbi:MAG: sulfatase-like hydrolase/transferase, partial [Alphaproteobacteria bacterium]|nr:sulfatase-like hydrolase/transferase [Alphaproteobacteria bacterium]
SLCTNTRVALMTGRYQYRLPIGLVEPLRWTDRDKPDMGLPPSVPTLPSLLRDAGYATALIGKWHLGYLPRYGPLKSGYDEFFGVMGGFTGYYTHIGAMPANPISTKARRRSTSMAMSPTC